MKKISRNLEMCVRYFDKPFVNMSVIITLDTRPVVEENNLKCFSIQSNFPISETMSSSTECMYLKAMLKF